MITNKEQIVKKAEDKLKIAIREYANAMDSKSNGEYYPIDVIEEDLVNIQNLVKNMMKETTEELLNSVNEDKEIAKKKKNLPKEG